MQSNTVVFPDCVRKKSIVSFRECVTTRQRLRCPMQSALHLSEVGCLLKDSKWEGNWKSRMIALKHTCTFLSVSLPVIWTQFLVQKGPPFQSLQQVNAPRWKLKTGTWGCSSTVSPGLVSTPNGSRRGTSPLLRAASLKPGREIIQHFFLSNLGVLRNYNSDMNPTFHIRGF